MNKKNFLLFALLTIVFINKASDDEEVCIICQDTLYDKKSDIITLACSGNDQKHEFHFKCIHGWQQRKKECPYCRSSLNSGDKNRIYDYTVTLPIKNKIGILTKMLKEDSTIFINEVTDLLRICSCCPRGQREE